jgi:hypothetical protein
VTDGTPRNAKETNVREINVVATALRDGSEQFRIPLGAAA